MLAISNFDPFCGCLSLRVTKGVTYQSEREFFGLSVVVTIHLSTLSAVSYNIMEERRCRSSSSASSLFIPAPKIPPQKGNFVMTCFSCPVGNLEQASSSTHSARPRAAAITENTYKMTPDKRFSAAEVRSIIQQHLQSLESQKYDPKLCRELAKGMSNSIMSDLKMLGYSRFKFVCSVTIGQIRGQDVIIASRSIWDTERDTFVSESFKNETLFAVGVVFGVYQE